MACSGTTLPFTFFYLLKYGTTDSYHLLEAFASRRLILQEYLCVYIFYMIFAVYVCGMCTRMYLTFYM
jgi:hypothetical protein